MSQQRIGLPRQEPYSHDSPIPDRTPSQPVSFWILLGGVPPFWGALPGGGNQLFYFRTQPLRPEPCPHEHPVPARFLYRPATFLVGETSLWGFVPARAVGLFSWERTVPSISLSIRSLRALFNLIASTQSLPCETGQEVRYCLEVHCSTQINILPSTLGEATQPNPR